MLKGRNEKHSLNFSNNQLANYFSTLRNCEDSRDRHNNNHEILAPSIDKMMQDLIDETVNCDSPLEDVKLVANKVKNGKASGLHMLSAELVKLANDSFMLVFTKLLNKLYKGGDEANLSNYRGITLLSIFGKVFLGVLLDRLTNVISQFEIREQNQVGFRKGYQTSDHIFTLHALIENYFRNNKGPLYVCFVDFKKAFDSMDHKLSLQQLVTYGIKGNFLKVISSLYHQVKSCVRGNDNLTDIFPCNRGVQQGCLLSPVFFVYI